MLHRDLSESVRAAQFCSLFCYWCLFLVFCLSLPCVQVTRSRRKADVCVGCHSPREGEEEEVVCVTEHWILGE